LADYAFGLIRPTALLVADDVGDVIWRVTGEGQG
jgi:hypothetical protein